MTNILLIIIAVLLAVRIVLQVRQGKRAFEKVRTEVIEVQNTCDLWVSQENVWDTIRRRGEDGFELVQVLYKKGDICPYALFFTRKKIRNFYEE